MIRWYIVCLLIAGIWAPLSPSPQKITSYNVLSNLYLPSLAQQAEKERIATEELTLRNLTVLEALANKKTRLKITDLKIAELGPVEKLTILYTLFSQNDDIPGSAINTQLYQNLAFFCGYQHLFGLFSPTTTMGKIELQKILGLPITDIEKLRQRQSFIVQLMSNPDLLTQLEQQLEILNQNEGEFLSFWKTTDTASSILFDKNFFDWFPQLNKNKYALELSTLWKTIGKPALPLSIAFGIFWFEFFTISQIADHVKFKRPYPSLSAYVIKLGKQLIKDAHRYPTFTIPAIFALNLLLAAALYPGISTAIEDNKISNLIQQKMIAVASFSHALQTIETILEQQTIYPDTLKEFSLMLNSNTFKGAPSFFSFKGKALAAFKTMVEIKDQFEPILKKIGEIDAFVSIAQFLKAHMNNQNAQYCFAEYEVAEKPHIGLTNYWHPLLNQNTVITNNFEFKGQTQSFEIPIFSKEITLSLILAQTLGIAPASRMIFTPLIHIN